MRISLKKIVQDIRELTNQFPEPYAYAVVLKASDELAAYAAREDPSLEEKARAFNEDAHAFADRMLKNPMETWKKGFFLLIQRPWNMVNSAAKKLPKNEARDFLNNSSKFFWDTISEQDQEAKGRRYGFWPAFLLGATAIGGIFAYSSGKSTKEYIEKEEKKASPFIYAGIGAAAVLGIAMLTRK